MFMIKLSTAGSKFMNDAESKTVINLGKLQELQETKIKKTDVSEEEAFFEVMRDIQGLDIIMSLHEHGCYTLPNMSFLGAINFARMQQKLAKRKMTFDEAVKQRKFRKIFGFYGYKILELCSAMSIGERKKQSSYGEI